GRCKRCRSDRDPCPCGGADRRTRPRHRRCTETTLDTGRWPSGFIRAAHSCVAPARSHVRSASLRSAFPKTLRGKTPVSNVTKVSEKYGGKLLSDAPQGFLTHVS